jgi:hypothetical protein
MEDTEKTAPYICRMLIIINEPHRNALTRTCHLM